MGMPRSIHLLVDSSLPLEAFAHELAGFLGWEPWVSVEGTYFVHFGESSCWCSIRAHAPEGDRDRALAEGRYAIAIDTPADSNVTLLRLLFDQLRSTGHYPVMLVDDRKRTLDECASRSTDAPWRRSPRIGRKRYPPLVFLPKGESAEIAVWSDGGFRPIGASVNSELSCHPAYDLNRSYDRPLWGEALLFESGSAWTVEVRQCDPFAATKTSSYESNDDGRSWESRPNSSPRTFVVGKMWQGPDLTVDPWCAAGESLLDQGRPREALSVLEKAYAERPRLGPLNYLLGEAHSAIGDVQSAKAFLQRTIDVGGGNWRGVNVDSFARAALARTP